MLLKGGSERAVRFGIQGCPQGCPHQNACERLGGSGSICWGVGVLGCWGVGVLGCWGVGVLGCWVVRWVRWFVVVVRGRGSGFGGLSSWIGFGGFSWVGLCVSVGRGSKLAMGWDSAGRAVPSHAPRSCPLYFDLLGRAVKICQDTVTPRRGCRSHVLDGASRAARGPFRMGEADRCALLHHRDQRSEHFVGCRDHARVGLVATLGRDHVGHLGGKIDI
jgi:hypothetical protein